MATLPTARRPVSPLFPPPTVVTALRSAVGEAAEQELVVQARRGDTLALDALLERHASRVYRVAFAVAGTEARTEAIVQSVFGLLLDRGRRLDLVEGLARWLYRTTSRAAVRAAMAGDSAKDRAAMALKDGEALGEEEVARALGEPLPLVRRRVHRARLAVCDQLMGRIPRR